MAMTPKPKSYYRADIEGLRAVAVILVIIFHARLFAWMRGGFIGVDVFFVISGYLITSIIQRALKDDQFDIVSFYERRIRRIFPVLISVVVFCFLTAWWVFPPKQYVDLSKAAMAALLLMPNYYFFSVAGYFRPNTDLLPLLHIWSLGVEEQFYIFVPGLLWFISKRARHFEWHILLSIAVASFLYSIFLTKAQGDSAFYLPLPRAWELLVGALIGVPSWLPRISPKLTEAFAIGGLLLIITSSVFLTPYSNFPGLGALPAVFGTALFIYAGTGESLCRTSRLVACAPLRFVGRISYSLYMWHWPIFAFSRFYLEHEPNYMSRLLLVVLSVLVAFISWRIIELPFRKHEGSGRRQLVFASAITCIALCFGAFIFVLNTNGLMFRFPGLENEIKTAAEVTAGESADGDIPPKYMTDCKSRGSTEISLVCHIGSAGDAPRFLVWGDSHARAMAPGFSAAGKALGQTGLLSFQHECPPIIGLRSGSQQANFDCGPNNEAVLTLIKKHKISRVFLIARWSAYEDDDVENKTGIFSGQDMDIRATFRSLMSQTVKAIIDAGAEVTIVDPVPEFPFDVPTAVVLEQTAHKFIDPLPYATYEQRSEFVLRVFERLQSSKVDIMKPQNSLCKSTCIYQSGGLPLYADTHHLSLAGALVLQPLIEKALRVP